LPGATRPTYNVDAKKSRLPRPVQQTTARNVDAKKSRLPCPVQQTTVSSRRGVTVK